MYHSPVQLGRYSREVEAVSWSQDHCIAVTSSEAVYVLILKGAPSKTAGRPCLLPFSMSMATVPGRSATPEAPQAMVTYDPQPGAGSLAMFLEPLLCGGQQAAECRESDWTPPGASVAGGCLLSCVTTCGHLWVLTPPGCQATQWTACADVAKELCERRMNGGGGEAGKPSKRQRTDHLTSACTTFHWLPHIIPTENKVGGAAIVAMATRGGCVAILAMAVPVKPKSCPQFWLLGDERVVSESERGQVWPCRLRWTRHQHTSQLAVGLTNGQLIVLNWQLPVMWKDEWREGRGKDFGILQPEKTMWWPHPDGMAVRHITWQRTHLPSEQPWLVFGKGSSLAAVYLTSSSSSSSSSHPPPHTTVRGIHSSAVSGLAALPHGWFVSCSLDGSVQMFQLPPSSRAHDCHVTPTPLVIKTYPTLSTGTHLTAHGVAASQHGLFAAVLTSTYSATSLPIQKHKVNCQLHLSPLLPLSLLHSDTIGPTWDVCEAIRVTCDSHLQQLPSNIQDLLSWQQKAPPICHLRLKLSVSRAVSWAAEEQPELLQVRIMLRHVSEALKQWQDWGPGQEGEEEEEEEAGKMSLNLMCKWVESCDQATPTERQLASKVKGTVWNGMETETCPICQDDISLTRHDQETCSNGHTWSRCCSTLLLAGSALCGCCRGCGALAHNTLSQQAAPGSWFEHLLSRTTCTLCSSYFELVV